MIYPRSAWQTRDIFIQLEHRFFYSVVNNDNSDWLISLSHLKLSISITRIKLGYISVTLLQIVYMI